MADSPRQEGPSPRQEAQEGASPSQADRQNLSLTGIPTPESSLGESSTPSSSGATIEVFNDGILKAIQAGKAGKWGDLIGLVQQITCNWWWMKNRGIQTGHHISPQECFSGFNITFDENNKNKVAEIVSNNVQGGCPPLLGFLRHVTRRSESLDFESIKKSISILGGFGQSGPQFWETVEWDYKKALHVAAEGRGPNSGHAIRALLELMDASRSGVRIVSLDDKTTENSKRTALHLAALNSASKEPFEQLLSAGADPWIQDSTGNTVLHLLNDNSRLIRNNRAAEIDLRTWAANRDNNRIEKIRSVLRQRVDGTKLEPHLVAVNSAEMTAMRLALSTKDYEMVAELAEASQTPSFRFRVPARDEKVWRNEGAAAFDLAVTNLDADLGDSVRSRLIRCLSKDPHVKTCVTEQDASGRTALHKACDLAEDRDGIVEALLFNGADVHTRVGESEPYSKDRYDGKYNKDIKYRKDRKDSKRRKVRQVRPRAITTIAESQDYMQASPGQEHLEQVRLYAGWSALSFASRRGHRWTVLCLLANGAMQSMTPAECSDIIQAAENEGYLIVRDLIQHFRTHDSGTLHRVLVHTRDRQQWKGFGILATKWPRKRTRRTEEKEKEVLKLSKYFSETEEFIPFENQSYPEQRMVYDLVKCDDDTSESWNWNTWTMKNGGWIHLPANYRKWIEDLCRAGYINEQEFPRWLETQQRQPYVNKDGILPDIRRLLQDTYLSEDDVRRIFPHIFGPLQQASYQQSLPSQPQRSSVDSDSPAPPLAMVCQKALAFIQDSLVSAQQHGSENPWVKHGFRSLVVQRQEQRVQSHSLSVSAQLPRPSHQLEPRVGSEQVRQAQQEAPSKREETSLEDNYTAKSIVLPILDVDWMLPYLEMINENGPLDAILAQQARGSLVSRDTTEAEVYRTRSDESDAMISEDMALEVEYRKDVHWEQMEELYRPSTEVQEPLSLDRYFHQDLTAREVRDRVSSQVVSRFIFYQRRHRAENDSSTNPDVAPDSLPRKRGALRRYLDSIRNKKADDDSEKSAGSSHRGDRDITPETTRDPRSTGPPWQQILIVPQLWLFTIDNTVITSFPDRWDHSNVSSSLQSCFSKLLQAQSRSIKADQLLHEIFECAMEYEPSFPAFGERFTFTEAFSGEIRRISRKIEDSYDEFHNNLGNSDDVFLNAFERPTYCLRTIDDILRELAMIKRVYQDQIRVWEDFHGASAPREGSAADNPKCPYSPTCDPKVLPERLFTRVSNLVEEAKIVQESAITLLSLLQGEASTENTISSSHQSKLLGIFTVVTVIFAPLSWIAAVFALQVQGTTWTWLRVFEGSFATVMITILLCLCGWLYLDWRRFKNWLKKAQKWAVTRSKNLE